MLSATSILTAAAAVAGLATQVAGHMSMWHPSMYGVGPNWAYEAGPPTDPIGPYFSYDDWWFRGPGYRNLPPVNGDIMNLPAGGSITLEIACHVAWTSYGVSPTVPGSKLDACPADNAGAYHSGDPNSVIIDESLLSGCALGIADVDDISKVTMDNLAIFSVKHDCVKQKMNSFDVPAKMPQCTGDKCICAWFWLANRGTANFYMTAFDCSVSGSPADATPIAPPQDPVFCKKDPSSCTTGSKRPIYAYNFPSNVPWIGNDDRAGYHQEWSFGTNGAQNDIFMPASYDQAAYAASMNKTVVIPQTWPTPTGADGAEDLAVSASVSASSVSYGQGAFAAIDGKVGGYVEDGSGYSSVEWASDHQGVGAWLALSWASPITFNQIQLYDRPNLDDQITSGNITFSDGSSVAFGALPNDGDSPLYLNLSAPVTVSGLRMTVKGVSAETQNVGLSEIEIYSVSSAAFTKPVTVVGRPAAVVSSSTILSSSATSSSAVVSSTAISASASATNVSSSSLPTSASSSVLPSISSTAAASSTVVSSAAVPSATASSSVLASSSTVVVSSAASSAASSSVVASSSTVIVVSGSSTSASSTVQVSSSSSVPVSSAASTTSSAVPTASSSSSSTIASSSSTISSSSSSSSSSSTTTTQAPTTTTRATTTTTTKAATTTSPSPTATNIAPRATPSGSSQQRNSPASAAVDGHIGGMVAKRATGNAAWEWASQNQGVGAYLSLKWSKAQSFNQIVLYDRPNLADQILGGNLTFSDGTRIQFGELNNDGSATVINLGRTVTCKSLLVTVTKVSATTTSVGLSEIQVYLADATKFASVYSPTSWALAAKAATPAPVVVATTSAAAAATTTAAQTTPAGVTFVDGSSTQVLYYADTTTTQAPASTSSARNAWSAATALLDRVVLAGVKAGAKSKRELAPTSEPLAPRHARDFRM